jgi:hypothetical protein
MYWIFLIQEGVQPEEGRKTVNYELQFQDCWIEILHFNS